MDFGLTDAQLLFRSSVGKWLGREVPIERVRTIMESESGFDRGVFKGLADQGITGLLIPERYDGLGLGLIDATVAAQEMGRAATPVSFHASCVLAPLLVLASGSEEQCQALLPGVASGDKVLSPILSGVELQDAKLDGTALWIADASVADAFVVVASEHVFVVPADTAGVEVIALDNIDDTRRLGEVVFSAVATEGLRLEGRLSEAELERAVGAARIILSADALGAMENSLAIAVEYAMQREQFDRLIGSFQAVKHMCAEMAAANEPIQSLVWHAADQWDQTTDDSRYLASLLKAHTVESGTEVVSTATQVFGGIGFTWECDMHLFYKRVGYARQLFGGPEELRARAADLMLGPATTSKVRGAQP